MHILLVSWDDVDVVDGVVSDVFCCLEGVATVVGCMALLVCLCVMFCSF